MKTSILATLLAISLAPSAFAGATNIFLDCASASGRTKLQASVPGDFAEHDVTFSIDGKSLRYFDVFNQQSGQEEKNSVIVVKGSMDKRNFSFVTYQDRGFKFDTDTLTFTAIPNSIKLVTTENGEKGSLRATVIGFDPRNPSEDSKLIEVKCTYDYEI